MYKPSSRGHARRRPRPDRRRAPESPAPRHAVIAGKDARRAPRFERHFLEWNGDDLADCAIEHLSREELELTLRVFPVQKDKVFERLGETMPSLGEAPTDAQIARWFLSACRHVGAS